MSGLRISVAITAASLAFPLGGCALPGSATERASTHPQPAASAPRHGEIEHWRLRELAQSDQPRVVLRSARGIHGALDTRLLQGIHETGGRILAAASNGPQPEILLLATAGITAFAFHDKGLPAIAFSLGMLHLLGPDLDAWAALFGHELAHLRLDHLGSMKERQDRSETAASLAGLVLSAIGLPFANVAGDATATLAERAFSRDDEREADRTGLDYMRRAGFAGQGAITLQQLLLKNRTPDSIPFLSTHPSGAERIENIRALLRSGDQDAGVETQSVPE